VAQSEREGATGRYSLFAEIASGGMASVHIGRLVSTAGFARTVAIKRLYPQFAKDPEFVAMFLDEAHLAARIKHPNVVPTLDIVRSSDQLLLVMEYVQGETLARLTKAVWARDEAMDPRVACGIIAGVLHGLHAAHEAQNEFGEPLGIVHRDVSPQNVLVGVDGVPRVVDFGVAKAMGQMHQTRGNEVKGKLAYMAPEQIRGGNVTRVSDVWAASVVLWETLAGRKLFVGDNDAVVMRKVVSEEIPSLPAGAASVSPSLEALVRKGLSRDPAGRFATARAMALALEQAVPLALASEIGECVEHYCGEAISRRSDQIREVETASRRLPGAEIISSSDFIADALWGHLKPDEAAHGPVSPSAPSLRAKTRSGPDSAPAPQEPKIELAVVRPKRPLPPPPPPPKRVGLFVGIGTVAVAGITLLAGSFMAPAYAAQKAIDAARARGVQLDIERSNGGYSAIHFHHIKATIPDVPGVEVEIADMDTQLSWLKPENVRLDGVLVSLDGSVAKELALLSIWYRAHRASGGASTADVDNLHIDVPTAHLVWNHAFGDDGRLEAESVSGEIGSPSTRGRSSSTHLGDELRFMTPKLTLSSKATTIGPWRLDVEEGPDSTTARIAFDPPVPDGPNTIITRNATGKTEMDLAIPRSPLYRLGVPPATLAGVRHVPEQTEVKLHYVRTTDDRVEATLTAAFFGVKAPPMSKPIDIKVTGSVAGDASSPLMLEGGAVTFGPVRATLSGPVSIHPDAVGASLAWKVTPVPCTQLLPRTAQASGDLAAQLAALGGGKADLESLGLDVTALAQASGVAHVSGSLSASGTVAFNSTNPGDTVFTVSGSNSCGISLFGAK
jgi:serine/threonine protein kinase